MKKILLIDDDADIHLIVKQSLKDNYDLLLAADLSSARESLNSSQIDLILLDVMLPDGSGTQFLQTLKADGKFKAIPVIMLTGKKELNDKLTAFHTGADDYIIKPFEPLELLARVSARFRISDQQSDRKTEKINDLFFDMKKHSLEIEKPDGMSKVELTPIEFKILYFLAQRSPDVVSREEILTEIWGDDNNVVDRTVDQHVSKVRKKIKESYNTIKSKHGMGYVFVVLEKVK